MNHLRVVIIALFIVILLLPLVFFNFTSDSVSLIDNRKLTENPFTLEGDITQNIENYVNDRIGFRDQFISAYTVLNDKLFGKMVHPSYTYGKDGYVFGAGTTVYNNFGDFHITFADMVKSIQDYCESRNVPFLFVFNPAKPAVYQDKIAEGVNYNREWVDLFLAELDARGVNYLDNTKTLAVLADSGEMVFNQKYDANHWNDLGAFYGTQAMLQRLNEMDPTVHINELTEFTVSETLQTSLLVSNFPIHEYVPLLNGHCSVSSIADAYTSSLQLHPSFRGFNYFINKQRQEEGSAKTLVFQGSYMNGYGYKFLANALGEYIAIHDYQNVIDFPYYFNIFQPECVIFEVAEYTFSNTYFDLEDMKAIHYNPPLSSLSPENYSVLESAEEETIVEKGDTLTVITWNTHARFEYVWLEAGQEFDMKAVDEGYQVTIHTKDLESANETFRIIVSNIQ